MNILDNIIFFCQTLGFEDYVFFFAVIILIVLIVSLIYLLKAEEEKACSNELKEITKKLEKDYKPTKIEFSTFEKEQEEDAIISYDELLENSKKFELNYQDETVVDGLTIQKVDTEETFHQPIEILYDEEK